MRVHAYMCMPTHVNVWMHLGVCVDASRCVDASTYIYVNTYLFVNVNVRNWKKSDSTSFVFRI